MYRGLRAFTAAALVVSAFGIVPSFAQKSGGILRVHAIDSPPWKHAARAHLVDIAVFCDSDDTHTASISYFDYVRLERR